MFTSGFFVLYCVTNLLGGTNKNKKHRLATQDLGFYVWIEPIYWKTRQRNPVNRFVWHQFFGVNK